MAGQCSRRLCVIVALGVAGATSSRQAIGQPAIGPELKLDTAGYDRPNETAGAASSVNPLRAVAAWNYGHSGAPFLELMGICRTADGGATWVEPAISGIPGNRQFDPMAA